MYFAINVIGILVFIAIGVLFSKRRREIRWQSVGILLVVNVVLAWFLASFSIGQTIVTKAMAIFTWLSAPIYTGISFVLPEFVNVSKMNFFTAACLPLLVIVPIYDSLTYFGIMPYIIKGIGKVLSTIFRLPKFECFYAVQMMFLGSVGSLAVSNLQLKRMKADRCLTVAFLTMSCSTAAITIAYSDMLPANLVLMAIPLNILSALMVTSLLHPVRVSEQEDVIVTLKDEETERLPFFYFFARSVVNTGRLVLIMAAAIIVVLGMVAIIDKIGMFIYPSLTLENVVGCVMYLFASLMGLGSTEAFTLGQYMGIKMMTSEYTAIVQAVPAMGHFTNHMQAVLTVFLTSFATLSTVGILLAVLRLIIDKSKNELISRNVGYLMLNGTLTSLISAGIAGLFFW